MQSQSPELISKPEPKASKLGENNHNQRYTLIGDSRTIWCRDYLPSLGGTPLLGDEDPQTKKRQFLGWEFPNPESLQKAEQLCERVRLDERLILTPDEEKELGVSQKKVTNNNSEISNGAPKRELNGNSNGEISNAAGKKELNGNGEDPLIGIGNYLSSRARYLRTSSREIDGFDLLEMGVSLTGGTLELAGLIKQVVSKGRQANADPTLDQLWERLEQLADRATSVEKRLSKVFRVAFPSDEIPSAKQLPLIDNSTEEIDENKALNQLVSYVEWIAQRVRRIDESLQPQDPISPLKIPKELSKPERLSKIEEVLEKIDSQLQELEQQTSALEDIHHPMEASDGRIISPEKFIDCWIKRIAAEETGRGSLFDVNCHYSLESSFGRKIELLDRGTRFTITNESKTEYLFECEKKDGRWQVLVDKLQPKDIDRTLKLPQNSEELILRGKCSQLINLLQKSGESQLQFQDYKFEIKEHNILGFRTLGDNLDKVFEANLVSESEFNITLNKIPNHHWPKFLSASDQNQTNQSEHKLHNQSELEL